MTRRRQAGLSGARSDVAHTTLLSILVGLLAPHCTASTIPSSSHLASRTYLHPRANLEHVVLADCRDRAGVLSSQVAYFPGSPNSTPQDVAIVATPRGQTRLWAGATSSALFTTTSVTFTAKIGPQVEDGQFAGTGNNGYGDFVCYQKYAANLYEYDGTTCSQVYDCNHDPVPSE
jgi:hypothetical protein